MVSKVHFALIKCGGWAVIVVLCLHRLVMHLGVRAQADALMHYSGGLAVTYALFKLVAEAKTWFGTLRSAAHALVAFTCGCTVAVFWELLEFACDIVLRTHVQNSLPETMLDLVYGTLGAATAVGLLTVFERKRR